jgi:hypothetical protein
VIYSIEGTPGRRARGDRFALVRLASIEVSARYVHHLGDSADRSAMQLRNDTADRALNESA